VEVLLIPVSARAPIALAGHQMARAHRVTGPDVWVDADVLR
jgi:hypothetical protein